MTPDSQLDARLASPPPAMRRVLRRRNHCAEDPVVPPRDDRSPAPAAMLGQRATGQVNDLVTTGVLAETFAIRPRLPRRSDCGRTSRTWVGATMSLLQPFVLGDPPPPLPWFWWRPAVPPVPS